MNKKNVMSLAKKLTAGVLAVGMVVAGIVVYPKQADAAVVEDKVIYVQDNENYNIKDYWKADSTERTAPVKEGYVFGGWFKVADANTEKAEQETGTTNYYAPLTESELNTATPESAYAKFVPAQVLSVQAQNSQINDAATSELVKVDENNINTISRENPMYVRVMSSLDSANYQKVGFEIELGNWIPVYKDKTAKTPTETTTIYTGLKEGNTTKTANQIFGGESEYLSVWRLTAIDTPSNASLKIYVRPYWVTTDGTKVEGIAKYVHIEDDYMGYISVPVNILNKEDVAKVAAGAVNMTYTNANANETVALTFKEVEAGRILPEMNSTQSGNMIKMVGNAKTVDVYNSAETLYANVRFIKPTTSTTDVDVDFNMSMKQFCDWNEAEVQIDEKWDVKYDAE